jgi:hypothetical protein
MRPFHAFVQLYRDLQLAKGEIKLMKAGRGSLRVYPVSIRNG